MSSESMKDQLNSIGIPYKDVMHNVFNKRSENESMKEGNRFVQSLFKRRNAIAHQMIEAMIQVSKMILRNCM